MAERLAYLEAVVGADITQFRKGMRDIRNETGLLSETIGGLGKLGRTLTFSYTAPLLALGTYAVQAAGQFDESMRNINAIAQLPIDQLDSLSQRVIDFGKSTRAGVSDTADALYTVFSAGLTDSETAFRAMEVSVRTAEAGLADVTTTTEALVSVMLAYGDTTEGFMDYASDAMTQMVAVGVGSMQEFANGMGNVIPTAAALGMEFGELAGDLAFLTQRGLSVSKASTSMNAALTSLVKPTEAMQAAMSSLGATGAEDLIEKFGGVNGALRALIGTTDGSQQALQALFNNIRGARAINQFANNLDAWGESMEEFNNSIDGATMRAWEQQSASFMATWDRMTSALEAAAVVIGQQLFPIVVPLIGAFTDFLNSITEINPKLLAMGVSFIALTAALPPLLWLFASLLNPVGLLTSGFIMLAGVIGSSLTPMFDSLYTSSAQGRAAFRRMGTALEDILGIDLVNDFGDFGGWIQGEVQQSTDAFDAFGDISVNAFDNISVTAPRSLWDIYESEGYSDLFNWEEFMLAATDGGWNGGAVTPDNPFTIDLGTPEIMASGWETVGDNFDLNPTQTLLERFEENIPAFVENFNILWNNMLTLVVPNVTTFVTGISNAIKGIDLSGLQTAFRALLTGDFAGVFQALMPETADTVGGILTDMFATDIDMSGMKTAFQDLGKAIGDFLKFEAVPFLAEAAGYLVGQLGVFLVTGMSNIWNTLMGEGNASEAGAYFNENIASPFQQGFDNAMEDTNTDTDGMFGGLVEGLVGSLALALTLSGTWGLVTSALLGGITRSVGGVVLGKGIFGGLMGSMQTGLSNAVYGYVGTGTLTGALQGFWTGVTSSAFNQSFISKAAWTVLGGAWGAAIAGVVAGVAIYFMIPEETRNAAYNFFWDGLNNTFRNGEGAETLQETIGNFWADVILGGFDIAGYDVTYTDGTVSTSQMTEEELRARGEAEFGIDPTQPMILDVPVDVVWTPSWLTLPSADDGNIQGSGGFGGNGIAAQVEDDITEELTKYEPSGKAAESYNALLDRIIPTKGKAEGGEGESTFDPTPFIEGYIIPLEAAWLARFDVDGSMTMAWNMFALAVTTGSQLINQGILSMVTTTAPAIATWSMGAVKSVDLLKDSFADLNRQLVAMMYNLNVLTAAGMSPLQVNFAPAGADGSHQAGLSEVPYDNYMANLHKGEAVLTAAENRNYQNMMNGNVATGSNTPTVNNTQVVNQITISGAQDVDGIMREMERRGVRF